MKFNLSRIVSTALLVSVALGLGACATVPTGKPQNSLSFDPPVKQPKNPSNVKVKLSTTAQRLYLVEGDEVLLASPISVGKSASPTPAGVHTLRAKTANRRRVSSPGAGYPMTYWMEFYGPAYGMHWGFIKPYPSTRGCVRLPLKTAKKVFDNVRVGTQIHVASTQPWDATIGKSLPVLDDSTLPDPPLAYMLSPQVFADAREGKLWQF